MTYQSSSARWANLLGGFYSRESLTTLLGLSLYEINQMVTDGAILELVTTSSMHVYPGFQFTDAKPLSRLKTLIPHINDIDSPLRWTLAAWLVTPQPDLDYLTPAAYLNTDLPLDPALFLVSSLLEII